MKITRIYHTVIMLIVTLMIISCDDSKDRDLYFVGDSIIARWDVAESFPSYITHNDGLSGANLDYIESLSGRYRGKDVVVMIGTNDNELLASETSRVSFAQRYIKAIISLDSRRVFLYSLLPRDFNGDRQNINSDILDFNILVESEVEHYPQIKYINVYEAFMGNGKIQMQYYSDGMHLTPYGYEILKTKLDKCL